MNYENFSKTLTREIKRLRHKVKRQKRKIKRLENARRAHEGVAALSLPSTSTITGGPRTEKGVVDAIGKEQSALLEEIINGAYGRNKNYMGHVAIPHLVEDLYKKGMLTWREYTTANGVRYSEYIASELGYAMAADVDDDEDEVARRAHEGVAALGRQTPPTLIGGPSINKYDDAEKFTLSEEENGLLHRIEKGDYGRNKDALGCVNVPHLVVNLYKKGMLSWREFEAADGVRHVEYTISPEGLDVVYHNDEDAAIGRPSKSSASPQDEDHGINMDDYTDEQLDLLVEIEDGEYGCFSDKKGYVRIPEVLDVIHAKNLINVEHKVDRSNGVRYSEYTISPKGHAVLREKRKVDELVGGSP